jgi:hypothetical protein
MSVYESRRLLIGLLFLLFISRFSVNVVMPFPYPVNVSPVRSSSRFIPLVYPHHPLTSFSPFPVLSSLPSWSLSLSPTCVISGTPESRPLFYIYLPTPRVSFFCASFCFFSFHCLSSFTFLRLYLFGSRSWKCTCVGTWKSMECNVFLDISFFANTGRPTSDTEDEVGMGFRDGSKTHCL